MNKFYQERVRAATDIYLAGKIDQIIISGHAEKKYYNEPAQIKKDLVISGVNSQNIVIDTTGSRTYLSIKYLSESGITDSVIIITQKFHNQRAVFLARKFGITAYGYNVPDKLSKKTYKTYFREILAKTIAFLEALIPF